jgi:Ca-activated chloride channel family protein
MRGKPIETAKKTMRLCIENMNPRDRFNLHSFHGGQGRAFDEPVANTKKNRGKALEYLKELYGSGGTHMMPAIKQALGGQPEDRVRMVAFMTDGYIGNDFAIIDEVRKSTADARVFAFGIGNSVNRFLLDNMAREGRGEVQYVTLRHRGDTADARFEEAAHRFYRRVNTPVLTHIDLNWGDLPVTEVYPKKVPDLFDAKPILVHGRLEGKADGSFTLKGRTGEGAFSRQITVREKRAKTPKDADAMASLWARKKVEHLTHQDLRALQQQNFPDELKKQVTQLGLDYDLMTPFTSFVAVEKMRVTAGGEPVTVDVPVEMPEGVSHEGVFGERGTKRKAAFFGRGGGAAGRPAATEALRLTDAGVAEGVAKGEAEDEDEPAQPEPTDKLAKVLRDLAEQVTEKGANGDLDLDGLKVRDWQVDVMVYLADLSDKTREALKDLGFKVTGASKTVRMLIGTIDVRKLEDLAKLETVRSVKPLKAR